MATQIYFVTETILKETTTISNNCDMKDVVINVKPVADMYVRSALGTYFYNDLLVKYNNATMNSDELNLLERMQDTIAWKAASESIISLSYQLKNKGIQTQFGDNSTSSEYSDIMFLVHHYSDRADFYLNRLSEYLEENKYLYPVFLSDENDDSLVKKNCGGTDFFNQNIIFI